MPRPTRHSTGQVRLRLGGRTEYCGRWEDPEAHAKAAARIQQWLAAGRRADYVPHAGEVDFTVRDLFALYWGWVEDSGRYVKSGVPTSSRPFFRELTDSFADFAGAVPVRKLGEALLVQWRDRLEHNAKLTRKGINRKVTGLLAVLRWGRARGHVPREVWADCSAIVPLQRGECGTRPEHGRPRRAPTFEEIERVAAAAPRQVAAMLRLQALSGMRPGEVCKMRWQDIDRNGPTVERVATWVYVVHEGKTAHHGQQTRYALPPAAQAILAEFPALPAAYVFSPAARMAERRRELRANRQTAPTKQTRQRDQNAQRNYGDRWDVGAYRNAVEVACARAGVERFTPHEVRHAFATWAANALGVMAASVALNHRNLSTTQRYLHADPAAAFVAAAAVQRRVTG